MRWKLTVISACLGLNACGRQNDAESAAAQRYVEAWIAGRAELCASRPEAAASCRARLTQFRAATDANERNKALEELDALAQARDQQLPEIAARYAAYERAALPAYHPLEVTAVRGVYADFGPLTIDPAVVGGTPSQVTEWKTEKRPWAGYWYPRRGGDLHRGASSPLAKFDRALANQQLTSKAAEWERAQVIDAGADSWEGLCHAWALAAILVPEPKEMRSFASVAFTVSDQKALVTKAHEKFPVKIYGVRYAGDVATDGTIQDLRPEGFHRILEELLGRRKEAFVIDEDLGIEVWQQPVYRVKWQARKDPDVPNAVRFESVVWSVHSRQRISDAPTSDDDVSILRYEYRLHFDPMPTPQGRLRVLAGEWLGDSIGKHPDFIVVPTAGGQRASFNPEFDKGLPQLRKLLAEAQWPSIHR